MATLSAKLKALIENPDDLSSLPEIVAKVEALESSELDYQERITKLQDINKSYLAQIPIPDNKPPEPEDEPKEATLEDAQAYLIETLGGTN